MLQGSLASTYVYFLTHTSRSSSKYWCWIEVLLQGFEVLGEQSDLRRDWFRSNRDGWMFKACNMLIYATRNDRIPHASKQSCELAEIVCVQTHIWDADLLSRPTGSDKALSCSDFSKILKPTSLGGQVIFIYLSLRCSTETLDCRPSLTQHTNSLQEHKYLCSDEQYIE